MRNEEMREGGRLGCGGDLVGGSAMTLCLAVRHVFTPIAMLLDG